MLKNILKLDGAQKLSKNEQKEINGGFNSNCMNSAGVCVLFHPGCQQAACQSRDVICPKCPDGSAPVPYHAPTYQACALICAM